MPEQSKIERQLKREQDGVIEAAKKYRDELDKHPERTRLATDFMGQHWKPLADAIKTKQELLSPEKKPAHSDFLLLAVDADCLAVITLHTIINALGPKKAVFDQEEVAEDADAEGEEGEEESDAEADEKEIKLAALARILGFNCGFHFLLSGGDIQNFDKVGYLQKYKNLSSSERGKKRARAVLATDWSDDNRDIRLGTELLTIAKNVKIVTIGPSKIQKLNPPNVVDFTSDCRESLEQWRLEDNYVPSPFYRPMIAPPNPWHGINNGGYLTNAKDRKIHLIKHHQNPIILQIFREANQEGLQFTLDAVNALQNTPWQINKKIHDVMLKAKSKMGKRDLFYQSRLVNGIHHKLKTCDDLVEEEEFYFPYQLDFRGRAYCLPAIINPQADDIGRSLLQFAGEGKPLGERGIYWLKVHLANSFGHNKCSFSERIKWTESSEEMIRNTARDPFGNTEWIKDADKPWRFLAACFEWDAYCTFGADFKSHLPIPMDGTCNGLQHLSALRLDELGAKSTNLAPSDQPQDLYQEVADKLKEVLARERKKYLGLAKELLDADVIDRKLVKKAVMTTPYGIGRSGMKKQFLEADFCKKLKNANASCHYLSLRVGQCIEECVDPGNEMKKWFQAVAAQLADYRYGLIWYSPCGFPVVHERWRGKTYQVKTASYTLKLHDQEKPETLSPNNQIRGIVAHFVHSLDAAHMMSTVCLLHSQGLRHFGVVHDCYAVHASEVDALHEALRKAFVRIYGKDTDDMDLLERFRQDREHFTAYEVKLPDPPTRGKFDIQQVLESKYFFC